MDCTIGWFVEHADGCLVGALRTLTMRDALELRPAGPLDNAVGARDYQVLMGSGARMGSAVRRKESIEVELHSPELPRSIRALAIPAGESGMWTLIWSARSTLSR